MINRWDISTRLSAQYVLPPPPPPPPDTSVYADVYIDTYTAPTPPPPPPPPYTPGDQLAGTPETSLGGWVSTTELGCCDDDNDGNLFDTITPQDNPLLEVDYRLVFIINMNRDGYYWANVVAWFDCLPSDANLALSVDTTPASPRYDTIQQAKTISSPTTPPAGQVFTTPTSKATGVSIGGLFPGFGRGLWVRRTTPGTYTYSLDRVSIRVEGNSAD